MYTGTLLDFLNMGGGEIMLILAVVLLLFGGKKLPELARGLGKGIRDFKDASEGVKREIHRNINSMDIEKDLSMDTPAKSTDTYTGSDSYAGSDSYTGSDSDAGKDTYKGADTPTDTTTTDTKEEEIKPNQNI